MKNSFAFSLVILMVLGCGKSGNQTGSYIPKELSSKDRNRHLQYLVQGKQLFNFYCAACHQDKGQGMNKLYPPLAKSDYMMADLGRTVCLIKNGQKGEITVNGVQFNMAMPAFEELSNIEIAEIVTYISNSWGNENGFVSVKDVSGYLSKCY